MFIALRNMFERNSLSTSSRSLSFLTGRRPWRRPRPSLVSNSARPQHTLTSSIPTTSSSPLSKQSSLISNNSCSRLDDPSSFWNFQVLIWPKGSKHMTIFFRFRRTSRSRAGLRSWRTTLSCWSISFWQISESIRTTMIRLRYFLIFHRTLKCAWKCLILEACSSYVLGQWFPNFSGARTTKNILVLREAQNIDLYWDSQTTWASMADH